MKQDRQNNRGKIGQAIRSGAPLSGGAAGGSVVQTRDPMVTARDPVAATHRPRRCIPASMPTVCPLCGHSTRMANGRYIDPANRRIVEYRTCSKCGEKLGAVRDMTPREVETLCEHAVVVEDYQKTAAGM